MHPNRALAFFLRLMAAAIVVVAVVLVVLPSDPARQVELRRWTGFILSVGGVAVLLGLASLLRRQNLAPPEVHSALSRLQQQLADVQARLNDLPLMLDRAPRSAAASAPSSRDYGPQLEQISTLLAELREISLLPDVERRQRLTLHRQHRKATMTKDLFGLVAAHDWSKAERLLITLETEFPNDDEVAKGRNYLDHSRKLFESEAVTAGIAEVEALMSASDWDRAWERAQQLVQGFPENGQVRNLYARVQRERDAFNESTVARLVEEIRHDIDRRIWRRALSHAERLLEQFPEHRLSVRVREQLKPLQDNAEIEERQELEVRIQELLRAGRFDDAIELAEDLIRRYPVSPQAESLETLLPRIRELSRQGITEFAALSPEEQAKAIPSANPFRTAGPRIDETGGPE